MFDRSRDIPRPRPKSKARDLMLKYKHLSQHKNCKKRRTEQGKDRCGNVISESENHHT